MFTGITEEIGKVQYITENKIKIVCEKVLLDSKLGDSISVDGVCLTVTNIGTNFFEADLSSETFRVSSLGQLKAGMDVNLERAILCNGRLGGHIVSGHVDSVGKVLSVIKQGECYDLKIEIEQEQAKYVVKKGSITVNGVSLTIAKVSDNIITIAVIPHTYNETNIGSMKTGDYVNIEVDIFAKYVEKFLSTIDNKAGVSMKLLKENGFC